MASPASYQVLLQFTVSSEVDITNDVEEISIDRKIATFQDEIEVGRAEIVLSNDYGRYTPTNSITPLNLIPGLQVQISGVASGSGGSVVVFKGTIDESKVLVSAPDAPPTATLRLSDATKALVERESFSSFYVKSLALTNSICAELLINAGVATTAFSLSLTGAGGAVDRRGIVGVPRKPASDALNEFIKTGGYVAYMASDGIFRMRLRGAIGSGSAVTTYSAFYAYDYSHSDKGVVNQLILATRDKTIDGPGSQVNDMLDAEPVFIAASSFATFAIDYYERESQSVLELLNPAVNTLHAHIGENGGGGLLPTSYVAALFATTAVFSVFNGVGSAGWITDLEIEGRETKITGERSLRFDQTSSKNVYGVRQVQVESDVFGGSSMMIVFKDYVFARYADPSPEVSVTVRNEYPFILTADLSDKLAIVHSETGIRMQMGILAMQETISTGPDGWKHDVMYRLRDATKI